MQTTLARSRQLDDEPWIIVSYSCMVGDTVYFWRYRKINDRLYPMPGVEGLAKHVVEATALPFLIFRANRAMFMRHAGVELRS